MNHIPVMAKEVIEIFKEANSKTIIDATLGAGGHSKLLFENIENLEIIGIDQDQSAIELAKETLKDCKISFVNKNFYDFSKNVKQIEFDGVLLDIGVSSMQLDFENRGFSYRQDDDLLDMRMDNKNDLDAKKIINTYSEEELSSIFYKFGEDRLSLKIAKKIVEQRKTKKIEKVIDLKTIIEQSTPKGKSPLSSFKRIFQAIRIEVNKELEVLEKAIINYLDNIKTGGVIIVISYHSLEDKIVKNIFSDYSKVEDIKALPNFQPKESNYLLITRNSAKLPNKKEVEENPRAKSARLRAIKKVA